ncbi:MAG: polymerase gamma/tau subunit, partial [Actinomycetota bacterium]
SLYRRFRPRKFSELYGQEHVVRALRNAVINGREGQAYLFSGPRGTGKTTTARILAKVLNCESPKDGEPCCACDSCKAVELGNSYDVLELDAASNNGVQEIRDLIESAALASPGRHRVFILDEVHMLTKGAEAALLKTLEEPPEHVVFVLATTDPQKVAETIRSRVQHLQFHLLPVDELEKYVRFVIKEAGLTVDDESIGLVLRQGGGSARDTLSALELVVSGGAELEAVHTTDEIIDALVAKDQGRVLAAVAHAMQLGRDPRTFTEDIVRSMRDSFLSVLAPELVQLPAARVTEIAQRARSLGNRTVVRVMEVLGQTLIEMRHAPDARLLLEVAMVRLSSPDMDDSSAALTSRIAALEERVAQLMAGGINSLPPAPVDASTGRAKLGGRANGPRDTTSPTPAPAMPSAPGADAPPAPPAADVPAPSSPPADQPTNDPAHVWPQIVDSLKPLAKAIFRPATIDSVVDNVVTVRLPHNTPLDKGQQQSAVLTEALRKMCGAKYSVVIVKDDTNAVERPVENKPVTIADEVAADEFKPIDPDDILPDEVHEDQSIETLRDFFPGGQVEDAPAKPKKK